MSVAQESKSVPCLLLDLLFALSLSLTAVMMNSLLPDSEESITCVLPSTYYRPFCPFCAVAGTPEPCSFKPVANERELVPSVKFDTVGD